MQLSEAFFSGKLRFESRTVDGVKQYLPLQGVVKKAFPESTEDTFILAFGCPIFIGGSDPDPFGDFILSLIPESCAPPKKPNIVFVCDFIDCLYMAESWDEQQVGRFVKSLEDWQDARGLGRDGL